MLLLWIVATAPLESVSILQADFIVFISHILIVPIYCGGIIRHAVRTLKFGVSHVTDYLHSLAAQVHFKNVLFSIVMKSFRGTQLLKILLLLYTINI